MKSYIFRIVKVPVVLVTLHGAFERSHINHNMVVVAREVAFQRMCPPIDLMDNVDWCVSDRLPGSDLHFEIFRPASRARNLFEMNADQENVQAFEDNEGYYHYENGNAVITDFNKEMNQEYVEAVFDTICLRQYYKCYRTDMQRLLDANERINEACQVIEKYAPPVLGNSCGAYFLDSSILQGAIENHRYMYLPRVLPKTKKALRREEDVERTITTVDVLLKFVNEKSHKGKVVNLGGGAMMGEDIEDCTVDPADCLVGQYGYTFYEITSQKNFL